MGCGQGPQEARERRLSALNDEIAPLVQQGRFREASPLLQEAVRLVEDLAGSNDPATTPFRTALADNYFSLSEFSKAQLLYQRNRSILNTASSLRPLSAQESHLLKQLDLRIAQLRDVKAQLERTASINAQPLAGQGTAALSDNSFEGANATVPTLHQQVLDLYAQGRSGEAEPLLKRTLEIYEEGYPADHPDLAIPLGNLAQLYLSQGRFIEAEPLFQRILQIQERRVGPQSFQAGEALANLAFLYCQWQRYDDGTQYFERALTVMQNALGSEHPSVKAVAEQSTACQSASGMQ